jgi:hypothetical protein
MDNYQYQKSFQFSNKAEDVPSALHNAMHFIRESDVLRTVPEAIRSRLIWVLTELLINGAKHSGVEQTLFSFKLEEKSLIIEKEDNGTPMLLKVNDNQNLCWPISELLLNKYFVVYTNGMDSLRIFTEDSHKASFSVEEIEDIEMPELLVTTSEHFGLMIITKASDYFSYTFDQQANKNIFQIIFNLP